MLAPARPSRASDPAAATAAAATAGTTTINPPVPIETPRCPLMSASSPPGSPPRTPARTTPARWRPPRATRRAPRPAPARRCGRPGAPAPPGAARCRCARGSPGPPTWWPGRPGGDGAGPPPRQIAVALLSCPGSRWPVVTCPGPGGPVTFSSATYVICHVNVNMTCHVIIGRKGCRGPGRLSSLFRLPGTGRAGTGPACRRAGLPAAEGTRGAGAGALRAKRGPCFRETSPTAWAIAPEGLRRGIRLAAAWHGSQA